MSFLRFKIPAFIVALMLSLGAFWLYSWCQERLRIDAITQAASDATPEFVAAKYLLHSAQGDVSGARVFVSEYYPTSYSVHCGDRAAPAYPVDFPGSSPDGEFDGFTSTTARMTSYLRIPDRRMFQVAESRTWNDEAAINVQRGDEILVALLSRSSGQWRVFGVDLDVKGSAHFARERPPCKLNPK
jgi:hypothetical protein